MKKIILVLFFLNAVFGFGQNGKLLSKRFAEKLTELNYDFKLRTFQMDHFFTGKRDDLDALIIKWFDQNLENYKNQVF